MSQSKHLVRSLGGLSLLSIISAITTYFFMVLVARDLSTDGFGVFSVAWSMTYTISGAVLSSAEPELTRLLIGEKWRSARNLLCRASLLILLAVAIFVLATGHELDGAYISYRVLCLIVVLLLLMLTEVLARSIFASSQRWLAFGLAAPSDSILRAGILFLFIAFTGEMTIGLIFTAMLSGTLLLVAVVCWIARPTIRLILSQQDNNEKILLGHRFGYGYLLLGTISMTGLISGVPVIVGVVSNLSTRQMGVLGAALMIARVPLILVMGFESVLVQEFGSQLQTSNSVRRLSLSLVWLSLLVGVAGFLIGYSFGPALVKIVVGQDFVVTNIEMGLFGSAMGFMLGAILLTPLNIALGHHARIAGVWGLSLVLFIILIFGFGDSLTAVAFNLSLVAFLCTAALSTSSFITKNVQQKGIS